MVVYWVGFTGVAAGLPEAGLTVMVGGVALSTAGAVVTAWAVTLPPDGDTVIGCPPPGLPAMLNIGAPVFLGFGWAMS